MKMKKKLKICIVILLVVLTCSACENPFTYARKPTNQPNTTWVSSDETIVFTVSSTCDTTGQMVVNGEVVEFCLTTYPGSVMNLYDTVVLDTNIETPESRYEQWTCSYKSKAFFIATVKDTTFFEVGKEISFYRVDPE